MHLLKRNYLKQTELLIWYIWIENYKILKKQDDWKSKFLLETILKK